MRRLFSMDEIGDLINSGQTIEVVLQGGAPWGFSLKGGAEHHCPLTIAKIEAGGKLFHTGAVRVDDVIVCINGVPCDKHVQAIQLVKTAHHSLSLTLYRGSSASDFRGARNPDLRKQAQENATMMKHAVFTPADADPAPKEVAEQKPVTSRVKKRESQSSSPRPKSWHTDYRAVSQPDLSEVPSRSGSHVQPAAYYHKPHPAGYNQFHSASESSFMNSSCPSQKSDYYHGGRSTSSLNNMTPEEENNPLPGHVQKKREAFERTIMSQSMDKINEEQAEMYSKPPLGEKQRITEGVNPRLRNIELEKYNIVPVETYPKVVVGKHITSSQAKAVLGRVPESGDHKGQWFGSVQDVSIHTVQMPQRQIASSADSSVTKNYAQSHNNLSSGPETYSVQHHQSSAPVGNAPYMGADRKIPPAIPKREDSKSKTQALSEHVKSSSWPATTSNAESTNTETVSHISILPSDLPPVKLNPNQEKGNLSSNSSLHSNPNKNSNSATQEVYEAKPVWFDEEGVFNYNENKLLNTKTNFETSNSSQGPPSPPTRDIDHVQPKLKPSTRSTDDRFQTRDHLIQDYRKYLEETEQQQEDIRHSLETGIPVSEKQDQQDPLSKTHHFQNPTQTPVTESQPLSQTMPARDPKRNSWYTERERQRRQSSTSSQESGPFSETEMNKRNNLLGRNSDRTWRNPSDNRENEIPQMSYTGNENKQPQPQQPYQPKSGSHSRQSSGIDDVNTPRMRSPISPMLVDSLGPKQDLRKQTFTQKIEMGVSRQESRDSRKSGIFEPGSTGPQAERPNEGTGLSQTFNDDNSILGRLQREGSKKNNLPYDVDQSEGNETSARKVVQPDTKRDMRNLTRTEEVRRTGKPFHQKSGSFTQDTRGSAAPVGSMDSRLNRTVPELSSHQRTHSIDTAPYSRNPPRRRESMERRGESGRQVSREGSFSEQRNIADTRRFWKQKTFQQQNAERGEHKKSRSDPDQHVNADQRHEISDPQNKGHIPRKSSDPENRQHIKDALVNYVNKNKRSPPGSISSPIGSRPPSISGSEQSLLRSEMYHSNSSLASYSSSRHYGQDSISSVGSSFSQPLHQPQDSGFGSNSDISQVRSPHSPPQTAVITSRDLHLAASLPKQGNPVSRSSSVSLPQSHYQSSNGEQREKERRRSHQPRLLSEMEGRSHMAHNQPRSQNMRMSLDSNLPSYWGQPEKMRQNQRSPDERLRPSSKQVSPSYNVHIAERKTISKVEEEESLAEPRVTYHSLQPEHTEASHRVFRFPSGSVPEPAREQREHTPDQSTEVSPPPPPTPVTPWEGEMVFPPPPPELAPAEERISPVRTASEQTVRHSPQGGSIPQMVTEQITSTVAAEPVNQIPAGVLEVQVESTPLTNKVAEDTTPSLSPNSIVSGRSTPDSHDPESVPSPQHVPRLPSVQENIPFTNQNELQNLNQAALDLDLASLGGGKPSGGVASEESEPVDVAADEEDGEEEAEEFERSSLLAREQEVAQQEIEEQSDPLLKWVLQSLTPNRAALADLFPLPKYKRSRSLGGTVKMTQIDPPTPTKSEDEIASEPRSPSECVNLVLSSSRYLRISPAKAIILKRARGMNAGDNLGNNNAELRKTQEELVDRISKKVDEIRQMQSEVADEMTKLEEMGRDLMEHVKTSCKASEYNKCNMYIADIDRVTKLLLSLTRRLNKVDSVLDSMENSEEEEKANLEKLKETISSQYQDARMLRDGIGRRHPAIANMLQGRLTPQQCDDFLHYVQMLPRLLIMVQELEDKTRLGEEQLEALRESLRGMGPSCPHQPPGSSDEEGSGHTGGPRDTNGNVQHGCKEDGGSSLTIPKSIAAAGMDEVNSRSTSSYC